MAISNKFQSIELAEELNGDGSLQYLQFKYKGSNVQINFGYDQNGKLNKIFIPAFLNLSQKEIFDIVNRFYIERINTIQTINTINLIKNIDAIGKIGSIPSIQTSNNIVKNGSFVTGNLDGWDTVINTTVDLTRPFGLSNSVKILGNAVPNTNFISQYIAPQIGSRLQFTFVTFTPTGSHANNLDLIIIYTDNSTETKTVTANNSFVIFTFNPTSNKRVYAFSFGTLTTDDVWVSSIYCQSDCLDSDSNNEVLPKAKNKTTIFKHNIATSTTANIYTVTAGKTFYLVSAWLHAKGIGTIDGNAYLDTGGADRLLMLGAPYSAATDRITSSASLALTAPMPFAAGTIFRVGSDSAGCYGFAGVIGWEE